MKERPSLNGLQLFKLWTKLLVSFNDQQGFVTCSEFYETANHTAFALKSSIKPLRFC